jgi:hypothetical protein
VKLASIAYSAALLSTVSITLVSSRKKAMIELILSGGPWTEEERVAILDYCRSDVDALEQLLPKMLPHIELEAATFRGRYMGGLSAVEHHGPPLDMERLGRLRTHWPAIKGHLIADVNAKYDHVYDEHGVFKSARFEAYLVRRNGFETRVSRRPRRCQALRLTADGREADRGSPRPRPPRPRRGHGPGLIDCGSWTTFGTTNCETGI